MAKRPKRLGRKTIYSSDRIRLHTDRVELPDGRIIEDMHLLDYPSEAVGAVVVDNKGKILLEYAYRYHTDIDGWEVPAGGIDKNETIIEAGKREVMEETGYETKDHELMYTYNPSNGSSNQVFHIIRCTITDDIQNSFDTGEVREVRWFTLDEVKSMIAKKEIADGYTLSALLLHIVYGK